MSKKSKELSGLSKDELTAKVGDLRKEMIKLSSQAKAGMKNPSQIKQTKKTIARALTFAKNKNK